MAIEDRLKADIQGQMQGYQSAYDIINMAATRQLRDLDMLRNDIRETRKIQSAQSLGPEIQGGFLEGDLNALEREYQIAKGDIIADKNAQISILNEQRRAQQEEERRNRRSVIGGLLGGALGAGAGFLLGGPAGAYAGWNAGGQIGGGLGGLS